MSWRAREVRWADGGADGDGHEQPAKAGVEVGRIIGLLYEACFIHMGGGAIPIVLGGLGGWKVLSDPATATPRQVLIAGALTLAAGIVGSLMAYWDLARVRLEHFTAGSKYKTLENEARRAREIHAHDEDYAAVKARVMDLATRYDELGENSAQSFDLAFWLARRKIRAGRYESEQARRLES